jgi:hypothetical protein
VKNNDASSNGFSVIETSHGGNEWQPSARHAGTRVDAFDVHRLGDCKARHGTRRAFSNRVQVDANGQRRSTNEGATLQFISVMFAALMSFAATALSSRRAASAVAGGEYYASKPCLLMAAVTSGIATIF